METGRKYSEHAILAKSLWLIVTRARRKGTAVIFQQGCSSLLKTILKSFSIKAKISLAIKLCKYKTASNGLAQEVHAVNMVKGLLEEEKKCDAANEEVASDSFSKVSFLEKIRV